MQSLRRGGRDCGETKKRKGEENKIRQVVGHLRDGLAR